MVVAPVLLVCELLKSEHEILVLTDNVVGFFEIDAKFAVKYFHIATPTFQQVINLENDSFHNNVLLECFPLNTFSARPSASLRPVVKTFR